jgi:glycosyltransferase involved in cell wall biosynthesis
MKVGIYFPGNNPEVGGCYTFEHDILLSVCEFAQQTRHNLVLILNKAPSEDVCNLLAEKGLRFIQLVHQQSLPRSKQLNLKIRRRLHLPIPPEPLHPFRAAVEQEKVELVWFAADIYKRIDLDVPYIATVFDIEHCNHPWFPEVSQHGTWQGRENYYFTYIRRAAYILTPNLVGQKEISLFYRIPPERFRLLPYPSPHIEYVPTEGQVSEVRAKYRLMKDYLLYPAQFWPHKNHANLLLALKVLKNKFDLIKDLVLVGSDKGNLEHVRSLVRTLELEDQVHFLGFIPREDLIALYHGAFALSYVSLFGPSNFPPLEAFVCKCPAIVSEYSGARQQCGDAALYVNSLDPEAIAEAILKLENQPELRQDLIERGSKRAGGYTWESYIKEVFRLFDEFEAVRRNWGSTYDSID